MELSSVYPTVVVLACGAVPAQACGFRSLRDALSHQGRPVCFHGSHPDLECSSKLTEVFATYHPAYLLRKKESSLQVKAHLTSFVAHLTGSKVYEVDASKIDILEAPAPRDIY